MRTQADDIRSEIKRLEIDFFISMTRNKADYYDIDLNEDLNLKKIYNQICLKKDILQNIQ